MATITVDSLEEVKADVYNKLRGKIADVMEDIAIEIEQHFESFVDMWYAAGPVGSPGAPKLYDRTFDTFYASSGYSNGIGDNGFIGGLNSSSSVEDTDDGFVGEAGITVSSSFMHNHYEDPVDYVFGRTWSQGIHGTIGTGGQTTPAKDMMDKWFYGEFKPTVGAFIRARL